MPPGGCRTHFPHCSPSFPCPTLPVSSSGCTGKTGVNLPYFTTHYFSKFKNSREITKPFGTKIMIWKESDKASFKKEQPGKSSNPVLKFYKIQRRTGISIRHDDSFHCFCLSSFTKINAE